MSRLLYESDRLINLEDAYHDLLALGIEDPNFHVIAKKQGRILRRGLNAANFWYKTNIVSGTKKGFFIGILVSFAIAGYILFTQAFNSAISPLGLLAIIILFTGFFTWMGGLLGIESKNQHLRKYYKYVDEGKYLLLIDTNVEQSNDIIAMINKKHPKLTLLSEAIDTTIPFEFMRTTH